VGLTSSALAQGGTIMRATYGVGNNRTDVTVQVQSMVQNGRLNFRLTNGTLRVSDPAPGRVKDLRIQVRQPNGQTREYPFQEKGLVDIQVANGSIQTRLNPRDQQMFDNRGPVRPEPSGLTLGFP
jgi:hypothetical protein